MLRGRAILRKITDESEPFSNVDIYTPQGLQKYEVIATIEHKGATLESGHYICYIKQNNDWYVCDDTHIGKITNDNDAPTKSAYMILLKKQSM